MLSDDMSNAQWLYHRCSKARASMGTPLTTLDLCVKILQVIEKTKEDDDIQIPLMEALKDAKQRDLAFIFELCERAGDLRDDDQLSEEILRAIDADNNTTSTGEEVSAESSSRTSKVGQRGGYNSDEKINFDEMQAYQLRTRVLGLNMPSFLNLWKYLQEAGWTYTSGIYHIPRGTRRKANGKRNPSAKAAFAQMDIVNGASLHMQDESDEGEQDEEGPDEFTSANDLLDYLDEYCMPNYRATPAEIKAQQKLLSTKSKAYERRNKRLRWELLEVAYRDRSKQRLNEDDILNNTSKYGHNNRSCEVCFLGAHPIYPRVACRDCRLVVHTNCYGVLDYGDDTTDDPKKLRADEKGLFTCDVCENSLGKINARKKATRWNASQSSGYRIHYHPNAICSFCESNSIAGGMIKIEGECEGEGEGEKRRKRKGADTEQWVHLFCLNEVLRPTNEPSAVRTNTDIATQLRSKLESYTGIKVCGSCKRRKGEIVKCRGNCGKYFHHLCIQIDPRNDTSYNSKDHLCLDCCVVNETTISQITAETDEKGTRTDETDQYFDKRPSKRQSTNEGENDITIPTIKKCVAEAQKLHQQSDLSPSFDTIEMNYQNQFKEWSYLLASKQSILLYGLGSKRTVLGAFGEALSNEGDVLNINGYDEDIDLNQLFDYIDQIFLDGRVSVTIDNFLKEPNDSLITKAASIAKKFASMRNRPLFILIHTIDGVGLNDDFSQRSLQALTKSSEKDSCPMIRIAASVDNINTAMTLWSPQVEHKFDWVSFSLSFIYWT